MSYLCTKTERVSIECEHSIYFLGKLKSGSHFFGLTFIFAIKYLLRVLTTWSRNPLDTKCIQKICAFL